MVRIAIFASGSGSNAENIYHYFSQRQDVSFVLIVTNNAEAYVHTRAKQLGIPSLTLNRDSLQMQGTLVDLMHSYNVDFIVLAGYLLRIPEDLVKAYPNRIVNIHPALLPKFGGKGMYGLKVHEAVLQQGETQSGITIHWVNERYDEGQIIFQANCAIEPNDTPQALASKVHDLEYAHFPRVLETCLIKAGLL